MGGIRLLGRRDSSGIQDYSNEPSSYDWGSEVIYSYSGGNPISGIDSKGLLKQDPKYPADHGWLEVQQAEAKVRQELSKSCACHKNSSADGCIPCELVDSLLLKLDTSWVSYSDHVYDRFGEDACADGTLNGGYITLAQLAFNKQRCHCLASTLYHELLHNVGLEHQDSPDGRPGVNTLQFRCTKHLCSGAPL
jgi:hypothetical protein